MIANTSLSDYLDILDLSLNTQISIYKSSFCLSLVFNVPIITTDVSDAKVDIDKKYGLVSENNFDSYYETLKSFLDNGFKIKNKFDAREYNNEILNEIYTLIDKGWFYG